MEDWQACSKLLSHILDYTGYCERIINDRRKINSEFSKRMTSLTGTPTLISGSKGEGLSNLLQSDTDTLLFLDKPFRLCETDIGVRIAKTENPTRYVFRVEKEWSPPGYCLLILASRPTQPVRSDLIESWLYVLDKGIVCLKGEHILRFIYEGLKIIGISLNLVASPALVETIGECRDYDTVPTISCPCSSELNAWFKRPRHYDWPSQSLQQDIISTPANIVIAGSKFGIFDQLEWRFCFNRAELKLMTSLNSTQNKVYVVLKMILKDYLKPENKEITSYVMKNIVFWMCERNPSSLFTSSTLLSWIYVGLQTLKRHIETGNLPYYMIPGRNLLQGKFSNDVTKTTFLENLSHLLRSGVSFVHVCDTIKMGLDLYNEGLLEDYGWKRNLVDMYSFPEYCLPGDVKAKLEFIRIAGINDPLRRIILPDIFALLLQGHTIQEIKKLGRYRQGLFLNPDKAEIFAETVDCEATRKKYFDL